MEEKTKKIYAAINAENEVPDHVLELVDQYNNDLADGLFIYNYTGQEDERENFLKLLKQAYAISRVPVFAGLYVDSRDVIEKTLDTGAVKVVIRKALFPEGNKIWDLIDGYCNETAVEIDMKHDFTDAEGLKNLFDSGFASVVLKHVDSPSTGLDKVLDEISSYLRDVEGGPDNPCCCKDLIIRDSLERHDIVSLLQKDAVSAVATNYYEEGGIFKAKRTYLSNYHIPVRVLHTDLKFADLKKNDAGLVPAIVQDHENGQVLMMAWMNEESFNKTIETGMMTYYSRSRQKLWLKGETSGHFQYVMSLTIDCDQDTILAKVIQIGAACHTGNRSCFFTPISSVETPDIKSGSTEAVKKAYEEEAFKKGQGQESEKTAHEQVSEKTAHEHGSGTPGSYYNNITNDPMYDYTVAQTCLIRSLTDNEKTGLSKNIAGMIRALLGIAAENDIDLKTLMKKL
ncbi:MAG: phosphoribosyl-AMP cyclohydrolase [Lachnospiraceae bacterium]|jgi:phosphoribosyl-ATP pyrophosphohydrolase/phosphoribosyl-AMP cyclohydrolase|nr:phosphoribosyl-AMP cyclohydrolase [Lachnospiraceae bacterium]MEE3460384.1 phosphoribosyl-AMP cyclohydrolase [Lachnospiraceae bacterium]